MSQPPKVSIIVPVYNAQPYIRRCIKSILNQTYKHLEIILVNDGSTDKSGEILQSFTKKDSRITLLEHMNKGPSFSRNRGLFYASGDYVQFVDADDTLHPTMTETLLQAMKPNVDLVICGYHYGKKNVYPHLIGILNKENFLREFGTFYQTMIFQSPCNKLYKLEIIQNHAIRFPMHQHYGEDVLFNLDYMTHTTKISLTKDVLYAYRQHDSSITKSYIKNLYATHEKIYQQIRDFLESNNAWYGTNKKIISILFAEGVIQAAANIFHPDNGVQHKAKCKRLQQLLTEPVVQQHLPYFKGSLQAELFRFFMKKQSYSWLCYYLQRKRTLQTIPVLTPMLQKINWRMP